MLAGLVVMFANNLIKSIKINDSLIQYLLFINCENSSGLVLGIGKEYLFVATPNATCI